MLEGLAALAGVLVAMRRFPGVPISIREDNAGLVYVFRKGTCRCPWTWVVAKAIFDLGKARFTKIRFQKVGRRTLPVDEVADHLSKGELSQAREKVPMFPTMEVLQEEHRKQSLCQCRPSNEMKRVPPMPASRQGREEGGAGIEGVSSSCAQ